MGPDPVFLDTLNPASGAGERDDPSTMARKNYSNEFRRQAVDLYESTPGATVRRIAEDLGIVRGTLRGWLEAYGTGKKTAADGTLTPARCKPSSPRRHSRRPTRRPSRRSPGSMPRTPRCGPRRRS